MENNKPFCKKEQGIRSVRNVGIHLSKYTESGFYMHKTLRILADLQDINKDKVTSVEKFYKYNVSVNKITICLYTIKIVNCQGPDILLLLHIQKSFVL